jgi:hypothetical protein
MFITLKKKFKPLTALQVQVLESVPRRAELAGSSEIVYSRWRLLPLPVAERMSYANNVLAEERPRSFRDSVRWVPPWFYKVLYQLERQGMIKRTLEIQYLRWWRRTIKGDEVLQRRGRPISWEM